MNAEGVNWARVIAEAVDRSKTAGAVLFEEPETVGWREGFETKLARRMMDEARYHSLYQWKSQKTIWHNGAKKVYSPAIMKHDLGYWELRDGPCRLYGAYVHEGPHWLTAAFLASGGRLPAGMSSLLLVTCEAGGETWLGSVGAY